MNTLHLLIASGETLPNLIPAIARLSRDESFRADAALIFSSQEMRGRAEALKAGLESVGVKSVSIQAGHCPDHDLAQMRVWAKARAEEVAANYHDCRRILNLTGGNKLMTIAFFEAFRDGKTELIYCDTEHDRIEYLRDERADPKLPVNVLDLKTYMATQGFKVRADAVDVEGIRARAEATRQLAVGAPAFPRLISALNDAAFHYENDKKHARTPTQVAREKLTGDELGLLNTLRQLHLLDDENFLRDEFAARYLGGGWLEEWCWLVGEALEHGEQGKRLKRDRWGICLKIDPLMQPRPTQYPLNELDAVFVHRNRMLLIECKTGMQISGRDKSQDILNKLEALGKHVGGRLDTKWLLTARAIGHNPQAEERAERYGIRLIGPGELKNLQQEIFRWMTQTH